jgi:GNAT superfamily N-acetyltransferase
MKVTNNVVVRPLAWSDQADVEAITKATGDSFDAEDWFAADADFDGPPAFALIGEWYAAPAGVVRFFHGPDRIVLTHFAVHPNAEGSGVAERLIGSVLAGLNDVRPTAEVTLGLEQVTAGDGLRACGFKASQIRREAGLILFTYTKD